MHQFNANQSVEVCLNQQWSEAVWVEKRRRCGGRFWHVVKLVARPPGENPIIIPARLHVHRCQIRRIIRHINP